MTIPYGRSIKGGISSGGNGVADTDGDTIGVLATAKTGTTSMIIHTLGGNKVIYSLENKPVTLIDTLAESEMERPLVDIVYN